MTSKLKLDIPLLLPEVADESDACVKRLLAELEGRAGIEQVHVIAANASTAPQLCIHYSPAVLSLPRIRDIVQAAGAAISDRFGHVLWTAEGMSNQRRARLVADRLRELPGVIEAEANASGLVRVEFDRSLGSEQAIRDALIDMDVSPEPGPAATFARPAVDLAAGHDHDHGGVLGDHGELILALCCGVLLLAGFLAETLLTNAPSWLVMGCYVGAYLCGGYFTLREAIDTLRLGHFEVDTLMLVAAAGAAALGHWAEGALLLFLFSLGHALEHHAMGRARQAIEALADLAPEHATVLRNGDMQEVHVSQLQRGDTVLVRPNERLPADGFVVRGTSSVDEAPITGESVPVDKQAVADIEAARRRPERVGAEHRVFSGTINGNGAIEIEVIRLAGESALARVVRLVSEAETQKSPTQRFADRFERVFVPTVLATVALLLFAWLVVDEPFRDSFYRAMAVLVAASPCALAIATPSAVLSGVARAARGGVLVKGGAPLELLGSLEAIAFDKTGTLTIGEPHIRKIIPAPGVSKEALMAVAVAVESLSDHPLAQAIASDGLHHLGSQPLPVASDLENLIGKGVSARVDGESVLIGKAEMFGQDGIAPLSPDMASAIESLRREGHTSMVVRHGDRDLGAIGLMDTPRAEAHAVMQQLRTLGIRHLLMLSGDHQRVATAVATEVGLDDAWGDLMPEDKVAMIRKLRDTKTGGVAMVGDGVNDAPAMASASVGIAMGAAGSDVALETADVALMADNLAHLPFAIGLSRHTRTIIRQNVFISLGVVALLVPATILGLGIGPAVILHEGSTLVVVFNALRLLAYRAPSRPAAAHTTHER